MDQASPNILDSVSTTHTSQRRRASCLSLLPPSFGCFTRGSNQRKSQLLSFGCPYFSTLLFGGSVFYSNVAHAWNDLIDAPLDMMMERTKNRPIARGAISHRAAIIFTVTSGICAASFLLFLPTATAFTTIPSIVSATYYPWAKKHTPFPQVVLGFCLAWGIMVGKASMAQTSDSWPWEYSSALCLTLAYAFAIVIYDTIYAHQDLLDDLKLGLGSTAILFRNHTKLALSLLIVCMAASLYFCGTFAELGISYFLVAFGGSIVSVGLMVYKVKLDDRVSCWFWFSTGFWTTMFSIALGLLSEYLLPLLEPIGLAGIQALRGCVGSPGVIRDVWLFVCQFVKLF